MLARLLQRDRIVTEAPLRFAGETSIYEGTLPVERTGRTELQVLAIQAETANMGIVKKMINVKR